MKTAIQIVKLAGKAAARLIVWVAGKMERGKLSMAANVETMFSVREKP